MSSGESTETYTSAFIAQFVYSENHLQGFYVFPVFPYAIWPCSRYSSTLYTALSSPPAKLVVKLPVYVYLYSLLVLKG